MKQKDDIERLLIRVPEAAELLSIARSKAYLLVQSGEMPSVKIGKTLRVPVAELKQWASSLLRVSV